MYVLSSHLIILLLFNSFFCKIFKRSEVPIKNFVRHTTSVYLRFCNVLKVTKGTTKLYSNSYTSTLPVVHVKLEEVPYQ